MRRSCRCLPPGTGSFIPALSEHNAGGTNVGRALITGAHLRAEDIRTRYFLGSKLSLDLRELPGGSTAPSMKATVPGRYRYAEMVFGNTFNVASLMASTDQEPIYAMRTPRDISLDEIVQRTNLAADDVRLFNPALVDRVPSDGTLYLPQHVDELGRDVAFWRRPPDPSYSAVLDDFIRLDADPERWDDPSFAPVLGGFQRRFSQTNTEEGTVMATVLAYAMDQAYASSRRTLLSAFRRSDEVRQLITRGGARARCAARPHGHGVGSDFELEHSLICRGRRQHQPPKRAVVDFAARHPHLPVAHVAPVGHEVVVVRRQEVARLADRVDEAAVVGG